MAICIQKIIFIFTKSLYLKLVAFSCVSGQKLVINGEECIKMRKKVCGQRTNVYCK